jgi:hypothetical protein
MIDQMEEFVGNPIKNFSSGVEAYHLKTLIEEVKEKQIHVLLSFRKDYIAEIRDWLYKIEYQEIFLEPLRIKGVVEAIEGVTKQVEAKDIYGISYASEVPQVIAQTILSDEQSHIAPLLQLLLRKIWDKVKVRSPRLVTKELFNEVKNESLKDFLVEQIKSMKTKFPNEAESGLILDILYFFTTPRSTAASYT